VFVVAGIYGRRLMQPAIVVALLPLVWFFCCDDVVVDLLVLARFDFRSSVDFRSFSENERNPVGLHLFFKNRR